MVNRVEESAAMEEVPVGKMVASAQGKQGNGYWERENKQVNHDGEGGNGKGRKEIPAKSILIFLCTVSVAASSPPPFSSTAIFPLRLPSTPVGGPSQNYSLTIYSTMSGSCCSAGLIKAL